MLRAQLALTLLQIQLFLLRAVNDIQCAAVRAPRLMLLRQGEGHFGGQGEWQVQRGWRGWPGSRRHPVVMRASSQVQ